MGRALLVLDTLLALIQPRFGRAKGLQMSMEP
jgi:hypothetical protein